MNGFLLLIPFLIIRFVLLHVLNKESVQRAAHFAPMQGNEKIAYYIYQISNITLFIYLFFLTVEFDFSWLFFLGVVFYSIGLCLCTITIVNFSTPDASGMNTNGIYRFSRNPMYIAYLDGTIDSIFNTICSNTDISVLCSLDHSCGRKRM